MFVRNTIIVAIVPPIGRSFAVIGCSNRQSVILCMTSINISILPADFLSMFSPAGLKTPAGLMF
jgi:hypothetical protein